MWIIIHGCPLKRKLPLKKEAEHLIQSQYNISTYFNSFKTPTEGRYARFRLFYTFSVPCVSELTENKAPRRMQFPSQNFNSNVNRGRHQASKLLLPCLFADVYLYSICNERVYKYHLGSFISYVRVPREGLEKSLHTLTWGGGSQTHSYVIFSKSIFYIRNRAVKWFGKDHISFASER